jgi:cephalosporin-C deacetylase-like acetyl esterase
MAALAGLPWSRAAAGPRGSMLWDWLMRELDEADSRRRERLEAVRTASDLRALGERLRRKLGAAIGVFPERTPLNARRVGVLKRRGYVIEKIIFESRPRYYVTANVYRPDPIASPRPAVIESCGHYREAKAQEDYQRACAGLATKGFVALVFDPMGQGERLMYGDSGTGTLEHVLAGNPCYLVGRTLAHYRIWDAIRALDYLETRPDVDKTRLGMFGHSGGGMMTLLTAPLEPRLGAVMSCCAVTTFYHKTKALLMADPEQIVAGVYADGIDHPEMIAAVGPRAFLIGAVHEDYVPLDGTRRTYEEVRAVFERAGVTDKLGMVETPGEHLLNKGLREACYGWMLKHLAGEPGDPREPDLPVESEQDLRCTPAGRVMDLSGARSVFDCNRDYARELAAHRTPTDLKRLLALPAAFRLESGIATPSAVTGSGKTLVVLIGPRRNPTLAADFAQAGCAVMELDLRGWGETTPQMPGRGAKFSWEDFFAYRAIEMGRPLLGMRVLDLVANVEKVRRDYARVFVAGIEAGGVIALHAAAVSQSISGVAAVASLASYQEVMEQPVSHQPVATFVPGALAHYDLPQLAASIRPRPFVASKEPDAREILSEWYEQTRDTRRE